MEHELLIQSLERTDRDIRSLRMDIESLRRDIHSLNAFRFKVYGIASFISAVIGFGINYFKN